MNKNTKLGIIVSSAVLLFIFDLYLIITGTKGETLNAWWALIFAILTILYGVLGLITAKYWSWLRSKIGQSIFFISLGTIMWGIGQAAWSYYYFKYPNQEYQPQRILDVLYFSSIPLWFYGVLKLTKASGARYGLKKTKGKILVATLIPLMVLFSYYFLVIVARGGSAYFDQPAWEQFFDLGYSIGDAVIFTVALAIFGLSWKYLGGRFKTPIVVILIGFGLLYLADFVFSYVDGKDIYFNGDISDLLYLMAIITLTAATCMLDPSKAKPIYVAEPNPNKDEYKEALQPAPSQGVETVTNTATPQMQEIQTNNQENS